MRSVSRQTKNILLLSLISIAATFFIAKIGFIIFQNDYHSPLEIWNRWDTKWYLFIAEHGYQKSYESQLSITYFPLYPWLIRFIFPLFKNYLTSALVISNLSFVIALVFFYRLVKKDYSSKVAWQTIFYFSIFPTAYFLHAGYSESLFLMLVFISIYFARGKKWFLAAASGMLAALTRFNGIILVPFFLVEYLTSKKFNLRNIKLDIFWVLLISLGFLFYLFINYQNFGNPFQFRVILKEVMWEDPALPWEGLVDAASRFFRYQPADWMTEGFMVILFWFINIFLLTISLKKIRLSYSIFGWLSFFMMTSTSIWSSLPRYSLTLFPIFIVLALWGQNLTKNSFITVFFLFFHSIFLILFIQGHWAF